MFDKRRYIKSDKLNNSGFSLVELIIVVSILAIAAIPLMKSMGMTARVNAKAQSIQNATSLGESIMEEVKSTPIEKLRTDSKWTFTDNGSNFVLKQTGVSATQGEKFDVTVTIDKATYSTPLPESSTSKTDIVTAANVTKLPVIAEIDAMSQAVFTSEKEFNKYDTEAVSYFNEKIADYPTHQARIATKTISIVKDEISGSDFGVTVKATVRYTDDNSNEYVRDLYSGSFVRQERSDGTMKPLDSNIFIFYKVGKITDSDKDTHTTQAEREIRETIEITDSGNYTGFADPDIPNACHKVYFIGQDTGDSIGPKLVINGETIFENYSGIPATPMPTPTPPAPDGTFIDGTVTFGKIKFISNLTSAGAGGHIYEEDARTRVYDITVDLYKTGDTTPVTTLNSTRTEGITPSPTPTPTPSPT
ncbi:MAG: prepilin-type N-terminal cleavage/methylation domain-containing protein [Lachnospiraceae bacterium]|nr:prepilin-type N-terminal cleavage/methylation domain-containing protein [Lachnospiraceae bacterium]